MDPALILVVMVRAMRDYQETIDSLVKRIAALEAKVAEIPPKEEPKADGIHEVIR